MDCLPFIDQEIKRTAERYNNGLLTVDQVRQRMDRLRYLKRKAHDLQRDKETTRNRVSFARRAVHRFKQALERGKTVVAFDAGFTLGDRVLIDVGITTLQRGTTTTRYLVVPGHEERLNLNRHYADEAEVVPVSRMRSLVQKAYDDADIAVFHTANSDLGVLRIDASETYFVDIPHAEYLWSKEASSLAEVCSRYGIDTEGLHNSAKDSRLTLEAMIAIANDGTPHRRSYSNLLDKNWWRMGKKGVT